MSAGTMIALAADEIIVGSHSQCGPDRPADHGHHAGKGRGRLPHKRPDPVRPVRPVRPLRPVRPVRPGEARVCGPDQHRCLATAAPCAPAWTPLLTARPNAPSRVSTRSAPPSLATRSRTTRIRPLTQRERLGTSATSTASRAPSTRQPRRRARRRHHLSRTSRQMASCRTWSSPFTTQFDTPTVSVSTRSLKTTTVVLTSIVSSRSSFRARRDRCLARRRPEVRHRAHGPTVVGSGSASDPW